MTGRKERNLKLVDGNWYFDFRFKGKRRRGFAGSTKDQARNRLTKLRSELLDVAWGLKKPAAEDVAFGAFADKFLDLYAKRNKRSWARDELSITHLKDFFKAETLRSIDAEKIERYKAVRQAEVSPATVNRELACLKTILAKAVEWGHLETSPAARVKKFREPPARERILDPAEAKRLIDAAGPDFRPVLIVAMHTGMRKGEILALKWADLDLVRGIITVSTSKSGKARKIPMSGTVAAALGALPRRSEFVFWNSETKSHVKDVKTAFHAACRRAKKNPDDKKDPGIVGLRFHDLRHTALTWMARSGADIVSVSKIAGHASIVMTQRYITASAESQRLAVEYVAGILERSGQKEDTVEITRPATDLKSYH